MTNTNLDDFQREVDCRYGEESYTVRNNGAVLRHHRDGKRRRALDDQWTFGKENSANPYLSIAGVRVHRIVATAFHGNPRDPTYVVDHIDSNCRNNRPENLRWLTRLENALKNPITRKKIEYLCGSIEAFLENPSVLSENQTEPNFSWMRTVSPEEARNCRLRMDVWANSGSQPMNPCIPVGQRESFGDRAHKPLQKWEIGLGREPGLDLAQTPWCVQYMWRAPMHFPLCAQQHNQSRLGAYFRNIKPGSVFAYSDNKDFCPTLTAVEAVRLKDRSSILVMTESENGKWVIVGIEFDERTQHFFHFNVGSYSNMHHAGVELTSKERQCNFWSDGYANQEGYA